MVILMGKSPTEAKYGPIGLKGLTASLQFHYGFCDNGRAPPYHELGVTSLKEAWTMFE